MQKRKTDKKRATKIKNEIIARIYEKGFDVKTVAKMANDSFGASPSADNLSHKINAGTIKYSEVQEIAEILKYKIQWVNLED